MPFPDQQQRGYRAWITGLVTLALAGAWCYLQQLNMGLGLTGLSRDVTWGLYIGQFTFADGLAASAAILVLLSAVHGGRSFRKLLLYGQILAIASAIACMLFVVADLGQPSLLWNVLLHPSPASIMFWDVVVLAGYLAINVLIVAVTIDCERKDVPPPRWIRPIALLSIPWAIGMQTVSAFLYCGLPGRSMWLTAILAPRFIVSAFASGTALLLLVLRFARLRLESETLRKARTLIAYTMALNLFFMLLEVFTTLYSQIPEPIDHYHASAPWMWISGTLAATSLALLNGFRRNERLLPVACAFTVATVWIEKGFALVPSGFVPSPLGVVTTYTPTVPEILIAAGIWAVSALIATLLFRTAFAVRSYNGEKPDLLSVEQEVLIR
jgi:molybdopterin-containing oxidoreductase family membrane subunit